MGTRSAPLPASDDAAAARGLIWDMAAWHMAWNASVAAMNDPAQPRLALRIKAQREYFALGKDFLERGIKNNPERPQLYEALARLYREKYNDHEHAAEFFAKAAELPGAPSYEKRFAAYELSYCDGREREAYDRLHSLYAQGEKERLPTLIRRLKDLEAKLEIPLAQRIPDIRSCSKLVAYAFPQSSATSMQIWKQLKRCWQTHMRMIARILCVLAMSSVTTLIRMNASSSCGKWNALSSKEITMSKPRSPLHRVASMRWRKRPSIGRART